ncbi:MAG: hypothetical protein ABIT38_18130, partial [Gemmatimonadaceae bacterium]
MNIVRSTSILCLLGVAALGAQSPSPRPMNFLDMRLMRSAGATAISPDGKWMLYTLSVPNWKDAKSYSDVYVVSTSGGLPTTRQLTFTKDKNESRPTWARDASFFVFASNRDAATGAAAGAAAGASTQQLYMMRPDGGEAQKLTDVKDGVGAFAFSKDGKWLAYSAGKTDEQQIMVLPVAGIDSAQARPLFTHATPVGWWRFSKDSRRIFFLAPDSVDHANKERIEKKFDVKVRNQDTPLVELWMVDVATGVEKRLTQSADYAVEDVTLSDDGKWAGFRGMPNDRYSRSIMEGNNYGDLYLL